MLAIVAAPWYIYVAAAALMAAGAYLTRKKKRENPDDFSGSSATMGSYLPLVIGRERVSPVFLHVEDATTSSTVEERAVHGLCVGPARRLLAVYQNGEAVWSGDINPSTHPSGSLVANIPNVGAFYIYWGFQDDPLITGLVVASRMPLTTRVLWANKNLGSSRNWPRLEYEVICPCYSSIANTPSELPLEGTDGHPTFAEWQSLPVNPGYTPVGRSGSAQAVFEVWGYRVFTRELVILDRSNFDSTNPGIPSVQWPNLVNLFPAGGIVKVYTYNNSVVVFENGSQFNDPLSFLPTGQWKYFWIAKSSVFPDTLQRTDTSGPGPAVVYYVRNSVRVVLGQEIPEDRIQSLQTTNPVVLQGPVAGYVSPLEVADTDGVNPVHLIDQVLFSKYPYGVGRDRSMFDTLSIERCAETVHLEKIRGGVAFTDGEVAESALAPLLQDMGIMICWDVEVGKYVFRAIRYEDTATEIPKDMVLSVPEMISVSGDTPSDVIAFTYKDRQRNYREVPVKVFDSGQVSEYEYVRAQKTNIEITKDRDSVTRIVPRRQQEGFSNSTSLEWEVNHGCFLAMPGTPFKATAVEGAGLQFRITEVQRSLDTSKVVLTTVIDSYNPPSLGGTDNTPLIDELEPPPLAEAVDPLQGFKAVETDEGVIFLAARMVNRTTSARVWLSRDNETFELAGEGTIAVRGVLSSGLPSTTPAVEEGPVAFLADYDFEAVALEDLTLDPDSWRAGRQVMFVGDEVIFLRAGFSSSLEGLIRGRLGTAPSNHAPGAIAYIVQMRKALPLSSDLFVPGKTVYFKLQAVASRFGEDIDEVASEPLAVLGRPEYPEKVSALRAATLNPNYPSASPLTIRWGYHSNSFATTGAGSQPFGSGAVATAPVEGFFKITITNATDTVLHVLNSSTPEITLSVADRSTFGNLDGLASWKVKVAHVRGSLVSTTTSLTLIPS